MVGERHEFEHFRDVEVVDQAVQAGGIRRLERP
jgi:hypothetical protein